MSSQCWNVGSDVEVMIISSMLLLGSASARKDILPMKKPVPVNQKVLFGRGQEPGPL